jgi:hypothetical protein
MNSTLDRKLERILGRLGEPVPLGRSGATRVYRTGL